MSPPFFNGMYPYTDRNATDSLFDPVLVGCPVAGPPARDFYFRQALGARKYAAHRAAGRPGSTFVALIVPLSDLVESGLVEPFRARSA